MRVLFSGTQYSIEAIFELVLLRQVWDHITDLHRTRDRMLVVLESTVHVRSPNEQDRRAASAVTGEVLGRIADKATSQWGYRFAFTTTRPTRRSFCMKKRNPPPSTRGEATAGPAATALRSRDGGQGGDSVKVTFVNASDADMTLSWVDGDGGLHHNYHFQGGGSSHTECCGQGHVFLLHKRRPAHLHPTNSAKVRAKDVVGGYRVGRVAATVTVGHGGGDGGVISVAAEAEAAAPARKRLRGGRGDESSSSSSRRSSAAAAAAAAAEDGDPLVAIDTSTKHYRTMSIAGFTVNYERNVWRANPTLRAALTADLSMAASLLPPAACRALQGSTPLYVNQSLAHGDAGNPTQMRHMCYHPRDGAAWLASHRMNTAKAGAIEIYTGRDYG